MPAWARGIVRFLLCTTAFALLELGAAWSTAKLTEAWYRGSYSIAPQEDLSNDMGLGMVLFFTVLPALVVAAPFALWGSIRAARKMLPAA